MSLSRRQFFGRFRQAAEGPCRWREGRIAQLCEYARGKAPAGWSSEQRQQAVRAVEQRLAGLSEESLRGPKMHKYVEAVLRSKDLFFQATQAEQEYYHREDSYYEDHSQ